MIRLQSEVQDSQLDRTLCQSPPYLISHRFIFFIHELVNSALAAPSHPLSWQSDSSYLDLL